MESYATPHNSSPSRGAPEGTFRESIIPATQWAHEYQSAHTETPTVDPALLSHINCSYFSAKNVAPTLLGLKQHAQALAILIKQISVSTDFCIVDATDRIKGHAPPSRYLENEAFDYLTDLNKPYTNDDEWHNKPLPTLHNRIARPTHTALEAVCPLSRARLVSTDANGGQERHFCSHSELAEHASDCLEILDHEYSATGGLLSMLPTDNAVDEEAMENANNTFLGQWLLFTQATVGRMHELELAYANALDTLAGEAAVPLQTLSKASLGEVPDAAGRTIAYPQDRFVLCNAGEDTFEFIHRVLDKQEALIEPKEEAWKAAGVVGERMWREHRGGALYEAGLVAWDVTTRFIRLRGKARSPIFILPAHGEHPAVAETRKLETQRPTVVSVRTPVWPAPVSHWQQKYQARLDRAGVTEGRNIELEQQNVQLLAAQQLHQNEIASMGEDLALFEAYFGLKEGEVTANPEVAEQVRAFMEYKARNEKYEGSWEKLYQVLPDKYHGKLDELYEAELGEGGQKLGTDDGGKGKGKGKEKATATVTVESDDEVMEGVDV
ncbi:hypothetical protein B0T11DRAFT_117872 [Plectosphaerella cucumerina]|uniref:Uncharacterized protein n=1 Tax=Plectosphaerella cucumerina TaxID=40658 RepID=A0A8K0TBR9_9PEZI|nr:hypothetical protein B0T11DRAFT_117872 [Plectosphaerella cucumerina]